MIKCPDYGQHCRSRDLYSPWGAVGNSSFIDTISNHIWEIAEVSSLPVPTQARAAVRDRCDVAACHAWQPLDFCWQLGWHYNPIRTQAKAYQDTKHEHKLPVDQCFTSVHAPSVNTGAKSKRLRASGQCMAICTTVHFFFNNLNYSDLTSFKFHVTHFHLNWQLLY